LQKQPARGKGIHDLPQFYSYIFENIHQIFVKCKLVRYYEMRRKGLSVY
jgi:hypothetical protein